MTPDLRIAVVVPVFRSPATLRALHERLARALAQVGREHRIVFVDDACPLGSGAMLRELAAADARVEVVTLDRNRGQNRAVLLGLEHAAGDAVVVLDCDLQDPPEAIPALVAELERGWGAVFAARRGAYEPLPRRWSGAAFRWLLRGIGGGALPRGAGLFVALSPEAVRRLLALRDEPPYVVGMIARVGLPLAAVPVERARRAVGGSSYDGSMRVDLAWNALRAAWRARRQGATVAK